MESIIHVAKQFQFFLARLSCLRDSCATSNGSGTACDLVKRCQKGRRNQKEEATWSGRNEKERNTKHQNRRHQCRSPARGLHANHVWICSDHMQKLRWRYFHLHRKPTTSVTRPSSGWNLLQLLLCLAANPVEVSNPHIIMTPKKGVFLQGHPTVCPVGGQHLLKRGSRETRSSFPKRITLHDIPWYSTAGCWITQLFILHVTSFQPENNSWDVKAATPWCQSKTMRDSTGSKRMTEGLQVS